MSFSAIDEILLALVYRRARAHLG